jgi:spermidine synthase
VPEPSQSLRVRYASFLGILLLFFLSGASGLVYQVIWIRLLSRIFGTTTFAVSALLAAFMAGLGLGSFLASRYVRRIHRPLRWFGALEVGVGLYALALNALIPGAERLFLGLIGGLDLALSGENVAKVLLSFLLLLLPTTLMGASLPLLTQQSVHRLSSMGLRTGALYAVNTFGAAFGCFAAGFYCIPSWGMQATTELAAAVNVGVGLSAIAASSFRETIATEKEAAAASKGSTSGLRWAIAAFALSGFVAIGLEVVWMRLFTLVFKGYTYSFTAMLSVLLLGIAAGSLAFARPADRSRDLVGLLGRIQIGIAVTVVALTTLLAYYDEASIYLRYVFGYDFRGHTLSKFLWSLSVLGVPTFLFGAQFPVVARLATDHQGKAGSRVGLLYGMNVVGSILGALVTGFALIPWIGSHRSLKLLATAMMVMALLLVVKKGGPRADTRKLVTAVAGVAAMATALSLAPSDLSYRIHESWLLRDEALYHYEEGATATVMVAGPRESAFRDKRIIVNGSSASNSTEYGLSVNRIQGSIPFLFARAPRKVLATCFGTGITFGTLSQFDVERIDGVDISSEVIRAASEFKTENYDVVDEGRLRIHIDDGRNFLLKSPETYDAITMEPMPPALAGVSDMYTREFYALCREHLTPGGIMSQWVPLYYLRPPDVKMLYQTFAESFPYVMVFSYSFDTFLVGSDRPLVLSPEKFRSRLVSERLARDLAAIDLAEPEQMFATFLMDREAMLAFSRGAPIVTDDLPFVEFSGPKAVDMKTTSENYLELTRFARPVTGQLRGDEVPPALIEALDAEFRGKQSLRDSARRLDALRRARRRHDAAMN